MKVRMGKKANGKKPSATALLKKVPMKGMSFTPAQKRWLKANMMRKKSHA